MLKFQMAPQTLHLISSGSKKRNLDKLFLFLSKIPVKEPLLGSPTGPLWRELPVYRGFLHISEIHHKIFPKQTFTFSQRP